MQQLQGKTALGAGGGRNNGKAIALAFAREGADLILVARQKRRSSTRWRTIVKDSG